MFSSAVWPLLCKSGLLSRIIQSRHSVLFVIVSQFLLFHKNDYSDEFIDTNYYKQNKQNDDFELYVTNDRFYKAYGILPTKTPTDFDKYVTVA